MKTNYPLELLEQKRKSTRNARPLDGRDVRRFAALVGSFFFVLVIYMAALKAMR